VLLHRHNPDLLVAELRLVDGSVIDMIRVLRTGTAPLRAQILVVANGQDDPMLLDALQEGADNFVEGDIEPGVMPQMAGETLSGGAHIAPWIAGSLLDHFGPPAPDSVMRHVDQLVAPLELTPAERQLLRQLAMGRPMAEVADMREVSQRDIAARVRTIYRKMQWSLRAGNLSLQVAA
ncbi:MAG: response regulator transcription factor, partial [Burkholderiales bacterium]|nr:response regulator transcription factor [Burkholderiales bacterium]